MKIHSLWFIAGAIFGAVCTLILGLPYVTNLADQAESSRRSAAATPAAASPMSWPKGFDRMISSKSITVGPAEMALIHTPNGRAVVRFDSSTPSSASYRWRCLPRFGEVQTGAGSVERKPGDEIVKPLALGAVSIDWLGRGTAGTILYYRPPAAAVELRPSADFDTLDLAAATPPKIAGPVP